MPIAVRKVDASLDAVIVGLASWTLIYQACLVMRWSASTAAILQLLVAVAAVVVLVIHRRHGRPTDPLPAPERQRSGPRWRLPLLVLAATAAIVFGITEGPWIVVWLLWFAAAVGGVVAALHGWRRAEESEGPHVEDRHGWLVLAMAAAAAVLARFVLRPEDDDAHYVHLSSWIAQHGAFPLRDTLYSDEVYAALYWPPVDSWPALTGTLSRITGISSPTVVYAIAPPVLTFLAVLAMWRLLRAWRIRYAATAVAIALVFLLWDAQTDSDFLVFEAGFAHRSSGNLFLARIWQGKVAFLCLVVPLLYVYLQRHIERPSRATTVLLVAAGIAGVGLSTSAMFVVPLLAVAAMAPVAVRSPGRAATGAIACAGYPVAAAIVAFALDGHTPDLYSADQVQPESLGRFVLGIGIFATLALLAALLAWQVIRAPVGRVMLAGAALVSAVVYAPGVGDLMYDVTGLSRTQWRLVWILPVGALVGAMVATAIARIDRRLLRHVVSAAAAGALVLVGTPVWATDNGATLSLEAWKLRPEATDIAEQVAAVSHPGDTILLPGRYGISLVIIDGSVKIVSLRFFTDWLEDQSEALATQRVRLTEFLTYERSPSQWRNVATDLRLLGVDLVCTPTRAGPSGANYSAAARRYLHTNGFSIVLRTKPLWCQRARG